MLKRALLLTSPGFTVSFPDEIMELCYDRVTPQTMEHANQDLERDAADRGKDHSIRITHSSKLSVG